MEPRPSPRADGRGWGGRGDSSAARRRSDLGGPGETTEREPAERPDDTVEERRRTERDERFERDRERALALEEIEAEAARAEAAFRDAGDATTDGGDPANRLRGPGEAPWVRYEDAGGASERPGARSGGQQRTAPPVPDLSALLAVVEGVRGMVPHELTAQVNALLRELLLTLRALIDWYLERLDGRPKEREVEDIPIE